MVKNYMSLRRSVQSMYLGSLINFFPCIMCSEFRVKGDKYDGGNFPCPYT